LIQRFGKKSERLNPDQFNLFNEAELIAETQPDDKQGIEVKPHTRRTKNPRKPTSEQLTVLAENLASRIGRYLTRRGNLTQDAENSYLADGLTEGGAIFAPIHLLRFESTI